MIGSEFTAPPDPLLWRFVECPDECNEPHPFMNTGALCSRGHEIDPCQGCAAWGEGCGAIYELRGPDRDKESVRSLGVLLSAVAGDVLAERYPSTQEGVSALAGAIARLMPTGLVITADPGTSVEVTCSEPAIPRLQQVPSGVGWRAARRRRRHRRRLLKAIARGVYLTPRRSSARLSVGGTLALGLEAQRFAVDVVV